MSTSYDPGAAEAPQPVDVKQSHMFVYPGRFVHPHEYIFNNLAKQSTSSCVWAPSASMGVSTVGLIAVHWGLKFSVCASAESQKTQRLVCHRLDDF